MASKKAGRAAGLAALAGLAYMASRGKDKKETPSDSSYDTLESKRMPAKTKAEDATESGDFMSRRLKTNPETGEAYSMDNLSPMSSGKSAPASIASTPSATRTAPAKSLSAETPSGAYRGIRSDMKSVGGGRSGGRGGAEAGEEAAYLASRPAISRSMSGDGGKSMIDRQNAAVARANRSMTPAGGKPMTVDEYYASGKADLDKEEGTFKHGGKVKKMASGGMTSSASKRADGIASKGKTRCKMY